MKGRRAGQGERWGELDDRLVNGSNLLAGDWGVSLVVASSDGGVAKW